MALRCIIVDDDELSRNVLEDLISETDLILVKSCVDAVEAFNFLKNESIDLMFLDIDMPKMSGIDLMKSLNELPQIILVTAHSEFAAESYEYEVTDFIIKPISHARFLKAVDKAKKMGPSIMPGSLGKSVFIKSDSRLIQLPIDNILYVEALGNYVSIYTTAGRYTILSTMKDIESKLTAPLFARVHRSFVVKIDKIDSIEDNFINIGEKNIPIGKNYKDELTRVIQLL